MPRHPLSPSHIVVALVLVVACTSERRAADTTATHSPQAAEQAAAETAAAVLTPADTSAAAVLAAVRLHGAPRVLHVIFDEQAREERLYDGVSRGDSGWLAVVAAVMPDADGDAVETIDDALRLALPRAPVRVLRLLADSTTHTEVWWACLSPSAAGDPDSVAVPFLRRATAAVQAVRDPSLAAVRSACLEELRAPTHRAPRS